MERRGVRTSARTVRARMGKANAKLKSASIRINVRAATAAKTESPANAVINALKVRV